MSAIATNGAVQAGGPYFIISRNLGLELGGAIGTLFYLGTTMAASLYVLGAVEVICGPLRLEGVHDPYYRQQLLSLFLMVLMTFTIEWYLRVLSLFLMALMTSMVYVGIKYVNAGAALCLWLVVFSLTSVTIGLLLFAFGAYDGRLSADDRVPFDNWLPRYLEDPDTGVTPTFYSLIALFFPRQVATGIMAGSNRSAVLENPSKSIPKGTLAAIAATTSVYLMFVWLFGCTMGYNALLSDKLIAMRIAWPTPALVGIGIVAASLGAAIQCIIGASNLLTAIANDGTIPASGSGARTMSTAFLARVADGPGGSAARAIALTGFIATVPCLAGNLDYIAAPISMAYLLMYGSVNLSCYVLCVLKSPGFRPQWRYYSWGTALAGVVMCMLLMLIISWQAAVLSSIMAFALLFYIKYQNATRDWGDSLTGFRYQVARDMLLSLKGHQTMHAKNWRPQILVLCNIDDGGNPTVPELLALAAQMKKGRGLLMAAALIKGDHMQLLALAAQLKKGRGLLMAAALIEGDHMQESARAAQAQGVLSLHLKDEKIDGFCKVSVCRDPVDAAITIMHHAGMGTMQPNSVLLAWPEDWDEEDSTSGSDFVDTVRGAVHAQKAVMVLKGGQAMPTQYERLPASNTVDIWWVAHDGGLLLLVPHLLSLHPVWSSCVLRLFNVIVDPKDDPRQVEQDVRNYLEQVRISAVVTTVDMSDVHHNTELLEQEVAIRSMNLHRAQCHKLQKQDSDRPERSDTTAATTPVNTTMNQVNTAKLLSLPSPPSETAALFPASPGSDRQGNFNANFNTSFNSNFNSSISAPPTAAASVSTPPRRHRRHDSVDDHDASEPGDPMAQATEAAAAVKMGANHAEAVAGSPLRVAPHLGVEEGAGGGEGDAAALRRRRRLTALLLNRHMCERSGAARLVVTNLPLVRGMGARDTLKYVVAVTEGLSPVLMIRGTGQEVITQFG
ncbi:amino acid permease-domain-containing protein [Tribonema minus]|uniref:Amino acid permease-domain-containing protein n=1 Tax=Tribonema minus TaxID=303371 RepID=A0A835Z753_9STRA|nr:amino acid permease-domain-containing protein [Tribonema minus]